MQYKVILSDYLIDNIINPYNKLENKTKRLPNQLSNSNNDIFFDFNSELTAERKN